MSTGLASKDSPRVLLVEDDDALRSLLSKELRGRGYDVVAAGSGSEAIDYVIQSLIHERSFARPALIISDIRLRSGNGLSIAEAVRAANYEVPLLLMTAFPGPEVYPRVAAIRECWLVAKPFDIFDFFNLVQALVLRGSKRDAGEALGAGSGRG